MKGVNTMNKNFYRIIFNKVRGLFVVVSEMTKSHQVVTNNAKQIKTVHVNPNPIQHVQFCRLKPLVFMSYIALGLVSVVNVSYANNIVVDPTANQAQRPNVHNLQNGVTQIDIAAPSNSGVSHNKYNQFDVSKNGVILNNATGRTNTQLAGDINGNRLLQNRAKVILNEVNSPNISQLNGYVEVAGQKAQVIIANPAGITCNGCGFINADRVTLTTGKPIMDNGKLQSYQVDGGRIEINGYGLKNSGQDYTDLIARSVNVNAELWANNEINVITGQAKVSADLNTIEKQGFNNQVDQPEFGLDVSALGGMYAGKIKMVGTENGVGVRNEGKLMASAGSLNLSADGKIINKGTMQSSEGTVLKSQSEIKNLGTITAKNDLKLQSYTLITNEGKLSAKNSLSTTSDEFISIWSGDVKANNIVINAKQAKNVGKMKAYETVTINASTAENNGNLTAGKQITLTSDNIKNDWQGIINAKNINLNGKNFENYGEVNSAENLVISIENINNINKLLSDEQLLLKGTNITNSDTGLIKAEDKVSIVAKNIINDGTINSDSVFLGEGEVGKVVNTWRAKINAKQLFDIHANQFENSGQINADNGSMELQDYMYNQGQIKLNNNLNLYIKDFKNDWNGKLASNYMNINKTKSDATITNYGVINADNLNILNNNVYNYGQLLVNHTLSVVNNAFVNSWQGIIKSDEVDINTRNFENHNELKAGQLLSVNGGNQFYNQGKLFANKQIILKGNEVKNDWKGEIKADLITMDTNKLDNYNEISALNSSVIKVKDGYNQGKIFASDKLAIKTDNFKNDWKGEINANQIEIKGGNFDNRNFAKANDDFKLNVSSLYNNGQLLAKNKIQLHGRNFHNDWFGWIASDTIDLDIDYNFNNYGTLSVNKSISILANLIYNEGKITSDDYIKLTARTLTNDSHGIINAKYIESKLAYINNIGVINGIFVNQ